MPVFAQLNLKKCLKVKDKMKFEMSFILSREYIDEFLCWNDKYKLRALEGHWWLICLPTTPWNDNVFVATVSKSGPWFKWCDESR